MSKKYHTWTDKQKRKHFSRYSTRMPCRGVKTYNKFYWGSFRANDRTELRRLRVNSDNFYYWGSNGRPIYDWEACGEGEWIFADYDFWFHHKHEGLWNWW